MNEPVYRLIGAKIEQTRTVLGCSPSNCWASWADAIWRESHRDEHSSLIAFLGWITAMDKLRAKGWPAHIDGREQ